MELVDSVLKEAMFGAISWKDLGLALGLYINTLDIIEREKGDCNDYLQKTIQKWLKNADNVKGLTWQILVEAVRSTGDNAAAQRIPGILKKHNITI